MNINVKKAYRVKAETIIKNLEKRNMQGFYFDTKEEAKEKVLSLIGKDDTVSWGGSMTVEEIGVKQSLIQNNYKIIDRDSGKTPEESTQLMKQGLLADVFLSGTNAITMDGELINIDGRGNRVAAFCYGPDSIIVVTGMNKVTEDLESGLKRVKTDACVPNAIRFDTKTPCTFTGVCADCISPSTICGQILITRFSKTQNRIKVVLVGESLGF